jgi:hypothetical protein
VEGIEFFVILSLLVILPFNADHGSRWAGQAITTDSWAVDNAPPRVIGGLSDKPAVHDRTDEEEDFYESLEHLEERHEVFQQQPVIHNLEGNAEL